MILQNNRNLETIKRINLSKFIRLILIIFIIGFCGFVNHLSAQKIVASLDLDRKEPRPLWFEYCRADQGLVTLSFLDKKTSKLIGLIKYDSQFKRQWFKQVFEHNNKKNIEYLGVLGDKILIFVSERFPKEDRKTLFYYIYNRHGESLANGVELLTIPDDNSDEMIMNYSLTLNKKRLLLFERVHLRKQPVKTSKVAIFESNDDVINSFNLDLPQPSDEMIFKSVKITNSGDVILLTKSGKDDRNKNKSETRFQISRYDAPDYQAKHLPIYYEDVYITDLNLKPDREGNIMLGGFFSNKNANLVGGLLFLKIDSKTHEPIIQNKQEFSRDFLANYLSSRQIEKGRELNDFYLDDLILRSDGGMLFIAEQYYISSTTYRDIYGFWYNRDVYHYDDVVVFSVSASGEIEWQNAVSKSQSGETPTEISYISLVGAEYLYLIYKARIKGLGNNVFVSRLEYDGKISNPKPFFDKISPNDIFFRSFSEQTSNDEAIIVYYTSKTKTFSLAKVIF